ncbi:hypothetical protein CQW23_25892 [Capsicum baccatum]|uniref:PRORP domain-containing protein n=1 Tax=Capsicum baccatum TaxID=33114 RepID=A0A2G2VMA5_CAPBA|nr:hypothetical protein CQW23_25892 [Capsicum baccatum]
MDKVGWKLVTIDLDPEETEKFAKSVALLATWKETNSSFQKFQVNAVVNGIHQTFSSKKWPLVVLHNRRITGDNMDNPFNRALIEKSKNEDAIYATPIGSNDNWIQIDYGIDKLSESVFQTLDRCYIASIQRLHPREEEFAELSNNNDNVPGIIHKWDLGRVECMQTLPNLDRSVLKLDV